MGVRKEGEKGGKGGNERERAGKGGGDGWNEWDGREEGEGREDGEKGWRKGLARDPLAHTNRLDLPIPQQLLHLLPSALDIILKHPRSMDQVQVDIIHTQLLERFLA